LAIDHGAQNNLGLDRQMFDQAYASGKFAYQVRRDMQNGMKVGVYSTPAFFIISISLSASSVFADTM
jgi:predicted DsbA family dithiol-disulfide isomerase